jgi:MoxR-like ATPase
MKGQKKKVDNGSAESSVHAKSSHVKDIEEIKREVAKVVVGQEEIVDAILRAILAKGHVLIEGVPGIAKTVLIRTISEAVGCKFSRIQFTVDLLPADITGITTYTPGKGFETIKGPIFANFVIADEINRAPPKTQSALLEAMQEKQVTIGSRTFKLEPPFFVMANNNPIESSGTYRLPEAQIDRFLFKLKMGYPKMEEEEKIINQNITVKDFSDFKIRKILSSQKIIKLQKLTDEIESSPQIGKYIVRIVDATRNPKKYGISLGKYIEYGVSPRASIALQMAGKADAVMRGQKKIVPQNIKNVAHDVLRHRILLNYSGQAEGIDPEKIIDMILSRIKVP